MNKYEDMFKELDEDIKELERLLESMNDVIQSSRNIGIDVSEQETRYNLMYDMYLDTHEKINFIKKQFFKNKGE